MFYHYWSLCFIFSPWLVYGDVVQLQQIEQSSVIHKRLLNHVFNRTRGYDPQHCLADCFKQNKQCKSFNFDAENDVCELNNATSTEFFTDYVDAYLFVYFENVIFEMKPPAMERHTLNIAEPGACDSFPCQNDGLCTLTEDLDFRCVNCSAGFYGKMCEMRKNPCWPDPCLEGTCRVNSSDLMTPICDCYRGFEGKFCGIDLIQHRFDCDLTSEYNEPIERTLENATVLEEMTLCFWHSTPVVDGPQYILSYEPDDVNEPERLVIWRHNMNIHVKLGVDHEEVFRNNSESAAFGHGICLVLDTKNSTLKLYSAGHLVQNVSYTNGAFQLPPGKLFLGYYHNASEQEKYFNGTLSNLYMWNVTKDDRLMEYNLSSCAESYNDDNMIWKWSRLLYKRYEFFTLWEEDSFTQQQHCPQSGFVPLEVHCSHDSDLYIPVEETYITSMTITLWFKIIISGTYSLVDSRHFYLTVMNNYLKASRTGVSVGVATFTEIQIWHNVVLYLNKGDPLCQTRFVTDGIPSDDICGFLSGTVDKMYTEPWVLNYNRHTEFSLAYFNVWSHALDWRTHVTSTIQPLFGNMISWRSLVDIANSAFPEKCEIKPHKEFRRPDHDAQKARDEYCATNTNSSTCPLILARAGFDKTHGHSWFCVCNVDLDGNGELKTPLPSHIKRLPYLQTIYY